MTFESKALRIYNILMTIIAINRFIWVITGCCYTKMSYQVIEKVENIRNILNMTLTFLELCYNY